MSDTPMSETVPAERRFTRLKGIAAPLPIANVNTDIIAPKDLMRAVTRKGLGWGLLRPYRFDGEGRERPDFVLNREPWRRAAILVAHENFGCGSSREHAAWALADFGIRAVIAPSFAEIFQNNCIKNRLLPVPLPRAQLDAVMAAAEAGEEVEVDLEAQVVRLADGRTLPFEVSPLARHRLLEGIDDIADTLRYEDDILAFEDRHFRDTPWLAVRNRHEDETHGS